MLATDTAPNVIPVPRFYDVTKSPMIRHLLCLREDHAGVHAISFVGDRDKAHNKTAGWRRAADRAGYTLRTKVEPGRLLLWVVDWSTPRLEAQLAMRANLRARGDAAALLRFPLPARYAHIERDRLTHNRKPE